MLACTYFIPLAAAVASPPPRPSRCRFPRQIRLQALASFLARTEGRNEASDVGAQLRSLRRPSVCPYVRLRAYGDSSSRYERASIAPTDRPTYRRKLSMDGWLEGRLLPFSAEPGFDGYVLIPDRRTRGRQAGRTLLFRKAPSYEKYVLVHRSKSRAFLPSFSL